MEISISDLVSPSLAQLAGQIKDLSPAFKDFGEFYLDKLDQQFRHEKSPYQEQWTPLSQAYLDWKIREGKIPKILQRRGHMRAKTAYQAMPDKVAIGFNDQKAEWHDRGTGTMPKRQLLPDPNRGLPEDAQKELNISLTHFLNL